mgnify:CR=1 FL=1
MKLWGFADGNFYLPSESEIEKMLAVTGSEGIRIDKDKNYIYMNEGQGIDLGGIAKGFMSDRLMEIFEELDREESIVRLYDEIQQIIYYNQSKLDLNALISFGDYLICYGLSLLAIKAKYNDYIRRIRRKNPESDCQ